MNVLGFETRGDRSAGRTVRSAKFERRSSFPVSAACLVANAVRETVTQLFCDAPRVRLLEPVLPDPAAWRELLRDARMWYAQGSAGQAAFVLRDRDARAFAASAFGEQEQHDGRELSAIEQDVLERGMRALVTTLSPVCGRDLAAGPAPPGPFCVYFEILINGTAPLRLGVAVASEPAAAVSGALRLDDLCDVQVGLEVHLAGGEISAGELLALRPGTLVPMKTRIGEAGRLVLAGTVLARGRCGTNGGRNALVIER